jgi:DHA1 family multidrug resistance protein-like MFS transporter
MINWKKNLLFVWLSQFLSISGFSFAMPFIPFYIEKLGVADAAARNMWVAQFTAAGYLSFCLFAPIWGFLADIYGRRVMLLRANFVSALLMPLMAFAPGPLTLVLIRFAVGAFSGTVTASMTLVSGNTPHKNRGFALGTLSSAIFSGAMAGNFLGGITVDAFGYEIAFFVCGGLLFLSGILALLGVEEDFEKTTSLKEEMSKFKIRIPNFGPVWYILLLVLIMGFARQFDAPFLPVLVKAVNGPEQAATWTGLIASMAAVAGVLSGSLLGWMADKFSAPKVAIISALLAGLLMIPQGLAHNLLVLIIARFGMIFFAGGLDPVFQIWLAKSTPDKDRGLFFGWASSAKSLGWVFCTVTSGTVAMFCGVRVVYFVAAGVFLLLIPIIIYSVKKIPES